MKKIVLITAITFLTNATIKAQVVNIPDANFKAYLVGNTAINTNLDTEIQVSEATAFTGQIYCPNLNIADLTGIEAFTGLVSLWCQGNLLTSIDLSANTSLIEVYCYVNMLTSLNLSANTNLGWVDCKTNQLTSLDVSMLTDLVQLTCSYNQLVVLDVSANPNLSLLYCRDNLLTTLNMANGNNSNIFDASFTAMSNPNLTCIEVDSAAYSTANWTNIDGIAGFSEDCISSGISNNFIDNKILIYPNPTTGTIFLQGNYDVTLTDITGRIIFVKSNTNNIDISNEPTGLYFLLISDNKGQIVQRSKVTKE